MEGFRQKQESVATNPSAYNSPKLEPLSWRIKSNTITTANHPTNSPLNTLNRSPAQSFSQKMSNKFTVPDVNSPVLKPSANFKVEWVPKKDLIYKQTKEEKDSLTQECIDFLKIHSQKLNQEWCFWYSPRGKNGMYLDIENYYKQQKPIAECDTGEKFINLYSEINKPSNIPTDNKLMFFRKGCRPLWEDYPEGGCWIMMLKKREKDELDKRWETLLLSCISESLGNHAVGVIISVRQKKNLIEIWVNKKDEQTRINLGEQICTKLKLDPSQAVFYFKEHIQSLETGSTLRGAQGYVFVQSPNGTPQYVSDEVKQEVSNFSLNS